VRENALRIAEKNPDSETIRLSGKLVDDPSPKVRLQLAFTLGEWNERQAGEALAELAMKDHADDFMVAAVMSSAIPHVERLVHKLSAENGPAWQRFSEPLRMLSLALERRDLLARLLAPALSGANGGLSVAQLQDYGAFLQLLQLQKLTPAALRTGNADALDQALDRGKELLRRAREVVAERDSTAELRLAAATLLTRDQEHQKFAVEKLSAWIAPQYPNEVQRGAMAALADAGDPAVPALLLARWSDATPQSRTAIIDTLLRREPWGWELLGKVSAGEIPAGGFDPAQRARLKEHESRRIRELAGKIFASPSNRAAVVESFRPALKLRGVAARGSEIYAQLCRNCHRREGQGNEVGPDLRSVAEHPPEKLLVNILDPSADVQPGFHSYTCTLKSGEEIYGIVTAETANSVVLKLLDGTTRTILRNDIASLRSSGLSLMPEGLEGGLSEEAVADLIAYLKTPSR
jgi:putative heme-binding domain-containing protein